MENGVAEKGVAGSALDGVSVSEGDGKVQVKSMPL
jgi:hypothetical protein